jgi:hypothetical protein
VSEVKGEDVRQGRLKEKIVAHVDPKANSLVADEDSGQLYTVLKKDDGFYAHQIGGGAKDVFLWNISPAKKAINLVLLKFVKNGSFYASANFQTHPFDKACHLIVADGRVNLRSRSFLCDPELSGRVNSRIYFYAQAGLEDYVFFSIKINEPLR